MPLILWKEKNAPLTIEEMDENFASLHRRLLALEDTPHRRPESLSTVSYDGHSLHFVGSKDTLLASIPFPRMSWSPKGPWKPHTVYEEGDLVYYHGGLWVCHMLHTSDVLMERHWWTIIYQGDLPQQPVEEKKPPQKHLADSSDDSEADDSP